MDQLKLVLEHKFWILAGLAVLLPPIGWYAATDNLKDETATRVKKIDDCDKKVDNVKGAPNEKWISSVQQIDRDLTNSVAQSQEKLYDHQKPAFTLPRVVKQALDKCKVTYRHEGTVSDDFLNARDFFVQNYDDDWKSVVRIVKPFSMTTGEGLVVLPGGQQSQEGGITKHDEVEGWRQSLGFTGGQMWDAQEDIWFLRVLMEAVARVNEGTTELGNSRIKKIIEATLRGGDAADLKARQGGSTGAKPGTGGKPAAGPEGMHLGGGAGGAGAESSFKPPKTFDANDIFGDDGSQGTANYDTKGRRFGEGGGGGAAPVVTKRWVEEPSNKKWRTRGFVLRLVMDEREIPTLLGSLTQSPFPVEILHVEHTVHTRGAGSDLSRATPQPTQLVPGAEPLPVEVTREQAAMQKKVHDSLQMAFNVNYLVDVTVAGKFTIYLEPRASRSKDVAKASSGSNAAAGSRPALAVGPQNAKGADTTGASGKSVRRATAKSAPAPLGKSALSKKGSPAAVAPPAKPGASTPAASSVPAKQTNPVPTKSGNPGK